MSGRDEAWRPKPGPEAQQKRLEAEVGARKVGREAWYLHDLWVLREEVGRETCEMRHIWVGVGEGAPRDHQSVSQSLFNSHDGHPGLPSSQGTSNFIPCLLTYRSSEEQDSKPILSARCMCMR